MMIKVLVVDDSLVFRKILTEALDKDPGIRIVGAAANGKEALQLIRTLRPHLVVLDVEMPEMDGLQTLDEIRRQRLNVGVIMFSSLTIEGATTTLEALAKGAFDFVPKPTGTGAFLESVKRIKGELIPRIRAYAESKINRVIQRGPISSPPTAPVPKTQRPTRQPDHTQIPPKPAPGHLKETRPCTTSAALVLRRLFSPEAVAIGVSTGGPNALNDVIPRLPGNFGLPIFLVQHMPPVFTTQLAKRLNDRSTLKVVEAQDGMLVEPATVYVAPGDFHMEVDGEKNNRIIRLNQNPPVNSCRPAVDVLFQSIARVYGGRAIAVVMTGMGQDGFAGCRELKDKGAVIIAQDKETCIVWGMPRFVAEAGLADRIAPLDKIAEYILEFSMRGGRR
ncbi:MAG: protein-glutamate methylesterase/protein-glutamine glutaminase [Dissulfurimicrobium sp.]|uniref:protein-glutamate methylesterase/protein-glutamine glutaminase n=1 Tax=Dissulfurimicrobium sp. TaxID=2022436 RepID=UPI003D116027